MTKDGAIFWRKLLLLQRFILRKTTREGFPTTKQEILRVNNNSRTYARNLQFQFNTHFLSSTREFWSNFMIRPMSLTSANANLSLGQTLVRRSQVNDARQIFETRVCFCRSRFKSSEYTPQNPPKNNKNNNIFQSKRLMGLLREK